MWKKINLIGIIAFLLLVNVVNADILWSFDYKNVSDTVNMAQKARQINFTDGTSKITTAQINFGLNKSEVSMNLFADYYGGAAFPSSITPSVGCTISTDSIAGGNINLRSIKATRSAGNDCLADFADSSRASFSGFMTINSSINAGNFGLGQNAAGIKYGWNIDASLTNEIVNDGVVIAIGQTETNNIVWTGIYTDKFLYYNSGVADGFFSNISVGTTTVDKFSDSLNVGDTYYYQILQVWLNNAGMNTTANMTQFVRNVTNTARSSYTIYGYAPNGESSNFILSISCNNGSNWVNSTNNSIFNCPNGQSSHDFIVRTYGNISGVYVATVTEDTPTIVGSINNTLPFLGTPINATFNVTDLIGLSTGQVIINDTGIKRFYNFSLSGTSDKFSQNFSVACSAPCTINVTGRVNDTAGNTNQIEFNILVAGTTSPVLTLNPNNFFNSQNTSIISLNRSQNILLNLSLSDDIDLFAIEVNITNNNGLFLNFSNQSLSGTNFTFTKFLNVSGSQGFYNVSIELTDSHTAKEIPDWKVTKLIDTLIFDEHLQIKAEGAIWSDTEKSKDRYSFEFTYLPFISPKEKVYIIESDSELKLVTTSGYKAHFVDEKNGKWIDFEGLEGVPQIEKLSDTSYRVVFQSESNRIKFKSIGGLNRNVYYFQYYLSNASISVYKPDSNLNVFGQDSIFVSFNVTGNGRNTTQIYLYNSSSDVINSINVSNTGTGTYFYNATFTYPFNDNTFFINATHIDINKENTTSNTKTFYNLRITQNSGYPALNFTILDEINSSRIMGTATGTFIYNGTLPIKTFNLSSTNSDNFSVNVNPSFESILTDYELTYSATGYVQRTFNKEGVVLTNSTSLQYLYLLGENEGIYGTFRVIDSFENALSEVSIKMTNSGGDILEVETTDDAGVASFWVNPDTTYIFTFTKQGYSIKTSSLRITSSDLITVILESQSSGQSVSYFSGITYSFSPSQTVLQNKTLYTFNFNLTSTYWNLTNCEFYIKNITTVFNQTSCYYNSSMLNASLNFNTKNYTGLIAIAVYQINNTYNFTLNQEYKVQYQFQGRGSLKNFLNDITNFTNGGFDAFGRFLLGIILTVIILGIIARESTEFRDPEFLIPAFLTMTAIFSYLGWYNIPLDSIPSNPEWLKDWIVFILLLLTGIGYFIKEN